MGYNLDKGSRPARIASALLAGLMACTLTGAPTTAAPAKSSSALAAVAPSMSEINSLLLFPASNKAGDGFQSSASKIGTLIKLKINGIGRYHATQYVSTMPSIQRALTVDESLTEADLNPPFESAPKGRKITKVVGTDAFILSSLDAETVDTAAGTVKITATVQVFAVSATDPIKTLTVSGSAASAGTADTMLAVEDRAIDNAAGKIVSALSPGFASNRTSTAIPNQGSGKKAGGSNFLLIVLAGILAGVLINGMHGGSSSSSSTTTTGTTTTSTGTTTTTTTTGGPPAPPTVQ
ncbi:MAG TPA: hypothetical protein VGK19_02890 [Capsulimonadaceae bacterium]